MFKSTIGAAVALILIAAFGRPYIQDHDPTASVPPPASWTLCQWDNNSVTDGRNGRAISPPLFPDIRVADDFVVPEDGCALKGVRLQVIEDISWNPGGRVVVTVYEDTGAGPGAPVAEMISYYERRYVQERDCAWRRSCYEYTVDQLDVTLPVGRYWLGVRNFEASGSGTNYWMTSDGGEDGAQSETGWFSLDAGTTWRAEGTGWHHAFELNVGLSLGACCRTDGGCTDYVHPEHCDNRYAPDTLCADLETTFCTGACCAPDGTCSDFVAEDDCQRQRWSQRVLCEELEALCGPYCPMHEAAKVVAPDERDDDRFGNAVVLAGRTLAVNRTPGGRRERNNVHVFTLEGSQWRWEAELTRPDPLTTDGRALAIDDGPEQRIVVGARHAEVSGPVYVYRRGSQGWLTEARLEAPDQARSSSFGRAVDISGDMIVVGAPGYRESGRPHGAIYIYRFRDGAWTFEQQILPSVDGDYFGDHVALGDGFMAISASRDDDWGQDSGALIILRFDGNQWVREAKLYNDNPRASDYFPRSLALHGNVIAAGDWRNDRERPAVVHVFRRGPQGWVREARVHPVKNDLVYAEVALSERLLVVGSVSVTREVERSGTAYVFELKRPGKWVERAEIAPWKPVRDESFGWSIAVDGELVAVGAPGFNAAYPYPGTAYVYRALTSDCNGNHQQDICDIALRILHDADGNGAPDECEGACCLGGGCALMTATECAATGCERDPIWLCDGDVDGNGAVNPVDLGLVQAAFGLADERSLCDYDLDCDGQISPVDVGVVQSLFGLCESPRATCGGGRWYEGQDCGSFECP
jgi:hypothetical protein